MKLPDAAIPSTRSCVDGAPWRQFPPRSPETRPPAAANGSLAIFVFRSAKDVDERKKEFE